MRKNFCKLEHFNAHFFYRKELRIMFETLSEVWIASILIIGVIIICVRWIIAKTTGKELISGDLDILSNLRHKIVSGIASNKYLIDIERIDGREAVKKEIEKIINAYIESTSALTTQEKDLLVSLDKSKLVNYVERELIRIGILADKDK